jgi:nucleoside-diphosphate-sugar epimerase
MDVAIAGGHGKIARRLTRLLAAHDDRVRSIIRNPAHADEVRADGAEPVVCDLEQTTSDELANAIRGADATLFAAGAGPGSGAERKWAVDRDAALKLLEAARSAGVERYVMISSFGAEDPPGGDDAFSVYLRAKAQADRALQDSDRAWTIARPGRLLDDAGTGRVRITVDPMRGSVPRDDVADVLHVVLHEPRAVHRTFYVNGGDDPVEEALAKALA